MPRFIVCSICDKPFQCFYCEKKMWGSTKSIKCKDCDEVFQCPDCMTEVDPSCDDIPNIINDSDSSDSDSNSDSDSDSDGDSYRYKKKKYSHKQRSSNNFVDYLIYSCCKKYL